MPTIADLFASEVVFPSTEGMSENLRPSPELVAIATRLIDAYGRGDGEIMTNLFSEDAAISYFGSGESESWRDNALRRGFSQYIRQVPKFRWNPEEIRAFEAGSFGWVETKGSIEGTENGRSAQVRNTMIFKLEKGVWKIVHVHNSIPANNAKSFGYEPRGFEELLDAALASPFELGQSGVATIMFTDIADSTTIAKTIGDTMWAEVVGRHLHLMQKHISDGGGTAVKSLGDGVMSSFVSARAALLTAQNIQQANTAETTEPKLQIRIGMHTGEVITSDADHFGTVVNKAARVAALASPNEIFVSDATQIMIGGSTDFHFTDQMSVPLKGLEGDHSISKLSWRSDD